MGAVADRRLWSTVDGRLVGDGDSEAVCLVAAVGDLIPDSFTATVVAPEAAAKRRK
jgi:hypothetical protein